MFSLECYDMREKKWLNVIVLPNFRLDNFETMGEALICLMEKKGQHPSLWPKHNRITEQKEGEEKIVIMEIEFFENENIGEECLKIHSLKK